MDEVSKNHHLQVRGGVWYYRRRVPSDRVSAVGRSMIFHSLGTRDIKEARRRRDLTKVFGPSKIPVPDLEGVGFTKLNLLAEKNEQGKAFTRAEVALLLDWSAQHTVKALRDHLAKDPDKPKKRVVAIYLTQADYSLYRAAMLAFGAGEAGKGLVGQEKALMKLIASLKLVD